MKPAWCDRALFKSPIFYTVCTSEAAFRKEMKRLEIPQSDIPQFISEGAHATAHHFKESDGVGASTIVCIRPAPEKDQIVVAGLLVHEAVHIWQRIRESIGEDSPSSEFEAYSVQWISQQLMWEYCRQTKIS